MIMVRDLPSNWDNTEVQLPVLEKLATGGVRFRTTTPYPYAPLLKLVCSLVNTQGSEPRHVAWEQGIKRDVTMLSRLISLIRAMPQVAMENGIWVQCPGNWK